MWNNYAPATTETIEKIFYSANFYAETAASHITQFQGGGTKRLFLYLPFQNVHAPYQLPPDWEARAYPAMWGEKNAYTCAFACLHVFLHLHELKNWM